MSILLLTASAAALAAAAAIPAPAPPDPVLAAIEAWRAARSALTWAQTRLTEAQARGGGTSAAEANLAQAQATYHAALGVMLTTPPATIGGMAALWAVLADAEFPDDHGPAAPMLIDLVYDDVGAVQRFPALIAAALARMAKR